MPDIRAIVVPYELGRLRDGVGLGPERLLEAGAESALAAAGATVETELIELEERSDNEIDDSFALIGLVSERVRAARAADAFPVVLSGSCFVAVGVVAGMGEPAPGVVWFDAHADFNEPETSPSGYFDGMGLAVLTGDAWRELASAVPGASPIPETAVVLAGARDLDDAEEARLEASAIRRVSPAALGDSRALLSALEALDPPASGLYVHVDLDVLDIEEARVNRYSAPGGISAGELEARLRSLLEDERARAVSLTAYEPEGDAQVRVPPIASRLLAAIGERAAGT
jgi:arginase